MRLLALETAAALCSAALWADGEIVAAEAEPMLRGHAEALMPMVRRVWAEAGLCSDDRPDAVAVTQGPGAFTGVRIGLAAARGLGLAWGCPVLGATTAEAVAAALPEMDPARPLVVALETKRDDLYLQAFDAMNMPLGAPFAASEESVRNGAEARLPAPPFFVAGDAAQRFREWLPDAIDAEPLGSGLGPRADALAVLIAARIARDGLPSVDTPPPSPLYLRPADARPAKPHPRRA